MNPNFKKMTFDEAVMAAKQVTDSRICTIIELALHPNGLWTVRYEVDGGAIGLLYEKVLNPW